MPDFSPVKTVALSIHPIVIVQAINDLAIRKHFITPAKGRQ
jgi:hypothetical protein